MRKPLSMSQIVCIIALWVILAYFVIMGAERIDGPVILTLLMSGVLVFIPVIKSLKKRDK